MSATDWTTDVPTEPGWYWYEPSPVDDPAATPDPTPKVLRVYRDRYGSRLFTAGRSLLSDKFVDQYHGRWCGPLVPPPGATEGDAP